MPILLNHEAVQQAVTMLDAVDSMEIGFKEEGDGGAILPQRINVMTDYGWIRVGPVVLAHSGWMGFKAMNLTRGHGVRYQVHLYRVDTGELVAIMDAQHLTTLRTGATSAVATRHLAQEGETLVAVLGSGPEAKAQLDAMHVAGYVSSARIYSPTAQNRERLAAEFRAKDVDAVAVDSAEAAVDGAGMVLAAVKSNEPVLSSKWLRPGMHINSVGTARPEQRELDVDTFKSSHRIVVDTKDGVFNEAGDALAARDHLNLDDVRELSELVAGKASGRRDDEEITLFKSVGTGIQDIALAAMIYERAVSKGLGRDLGEFPYLKRQK